MLFDTLAYAKKLQQVGVSAEQAEVHAESLKEILDDNIATKRDLEEARLDLKRDIKEMEIRISIRLGGMMVVAIGAMATLVKIL